MTYQDVVLIFGGLLVIGALLAGLARRSFLSLAALFVLTGLALGHAGADFLDFKSRSGFVVDLGVSALIVILFRDGLEVESEMLQRAWRPPLRKLVVGMPVTAAIVAVVTRAATGLSWTQAFLVGALLSPTDPVLSNAVVTNHRVPRTVRHSLNLESGLNDGLALPPVLALSAALDPNVHNFHVLRFIAQDIGVGVVYGLVLGLLATVVMPRGRQLERDAIPPHEKSLYGLGAAFLIYGATVLPPHGNGFIAVYVAAMVIGNRRHDLRAAFERRADDIIEVLKLGIFVVFGSLLTLHGLFREGWAAAAVAATALLVARPVAVWISLIGTRLDGATKAFMGWFGPKGISTMTFSLLVLSRGVEGAQRIFDLAALTVFCSVIAHGLTDTPGVEWLARRVSRDVEDATARTAEDEASAPPGAQA